MEKLKINGLYEHYKGQRYIVKQIARHSETLEWLVIYECQYENPLGRVWARPMDMFLEEVTVGEKKMPRFRCLDSE